MKHLRIAAIILAAFVSLAHGAEEPVVTVDAKSLAQQPYDYEKALIALKWEPRMKQMSRESWMLSQHVVGYRTVFATISAAIEKEFARNVDEPVYGRIAGITDETVELRVLGNAFREKEEAREFYWLP